MRLLVRMARARGLDAIAVTNHDYYTTFNVDSGDLTIIPGIEISTTLGHVLVVGPDPPAMATPRRMTPAEAIALAHTRGCAAIVAHPFRNSTVVGSDASFDAIEVNGKRSATVNRLHALAEEYDRPLVGGSDAHYPFEVGRTYTVIDRSDLTPSGVVRAIRAGRVTYEIDERHPSQLLRRGYRVVHRLKGHTTPRSPATGFDPEP